MSDAPLSGVSPVEPTTELPGGLIVRGPNTIIQQRNGMSVAGFVCALHGFIPFVGLVLCILGIVFSAIGMARAKERRGAGKGLAIAGLVLSIVFFIPAILWIVAR